MEFLFKKKKKWKSSIQKIFLETQKKSDIQNSLKIFSQLRDVEVVKVIVGSHRNKELFTKTKYIFLFENQNCNKKQKIFQDRIEKSDGLK